MKNMVIICTVCIFLALTALAKAGTITQDFDTIGASLGEGGHLIDQLSGLTFTGAYIAKEGSNPQIYAYWAGTGYGTDGAYSGSYSITDLRGDGPTGFGNPSYPVSVSFSTPIDDLSFYAMDIDGSNDKREILTASVYDNFLNLLQTITVISGDSGTGDGTAKLVEFTAGNISSLEIEVKLMNGHQEGAWALDDLSYTPVPVPGAIWLLGSGLIGLAAFGGRRGKS